jgi:hypothetical protein
MKIFSFFIATQGRMPYVFSMVTSSILALTETLKNTPALALTDAQVAALAALATQIEFAIQDRQAEIDGALAQVEQFEADEFRAMAFASDRMTFSGPFFDLAK